MEEQVIRRGAKKNCVHKRHRYVTISSSIATTGVKHILGNTKAQIIEGLESSLLQTEFSGRTPNETRTAYGLGPYGSSTVNVGAEPVTGRDSVLDILDKVKDEVVAPY